MPAKSAAQQKLMGAALARERGKGACKGGAAKVAGSMSEEQLKDFAGTKRNGLPAKVNPHTLNEDARSDYFNGRGRFRTRGKAKK